MNRLQRPWGGDGAALEMPRRRPWWSRLVWCHGYLFHAPQSGHAVVEVCVTTPAKARRLARVRPGWWQTPMGPLTVMVRLEMKPVDWVATAEDGWEAVP